MQVEIFHNFQQQWQYHQYSEIPIYYGCIFN